MGVYTNFRSRCLITTVSLHIYRLIANHGIRYVFLLQAIRGLSGNGGFPTTIRSMMFPYNEVVYGERMTVNHDVTGSSPVRGAIFGCQF